MAGKRLGCGKNVGTCCCVFGCSMRTGTNLLSKIKMYSFPKEQERLNAWIVAVKRKDWKPKKSSLVCSQHFISGRPSLDPEHPDYVPNVFSFKEPVRKRRKQSRIELEEDPKNVADDSIQIENMPVNPELFSACDVEEFSEIKKNVFEMKSEIEKLTTDSVNVENDDEHFDTDDTESVCETVGEAEDEYLSLKLELYEAYTDISSLKKEKDAILEVLSASEEEQKTLHDAVSEKEKELSKLKLELQQAYEEINVLRSEKDAMQKKVASSDLTNRMLQDAKELYFYTGVHSTKDFHSILALIYNVDTAVKIFPMTTQLLIVLMKLRLNMLYQDLSFRFQTSRNTVQRICVKIIPILEKKLELFIKSPVTKASKQTIPSCYHKNTVFETLYNRIQRFVKSEAKQSENEDEDCDSM